MTMAPLLEPDSSLALQLARYALVSAVLHFYATHRIGPFPTGLTLFLTLLTIGLLGRIWLSFVTEHAPEPYLDEVFHIPQAQVYCDGKYSVWDDKITTPPGLYVLTILANKLAEYPCSVYHLRLFNVEVISYLALAAIKSRVQLEQLGAIDHAQASRLYSPDSAWLGINVALFPVLFFFSGLYYTDVISTFVVLLAYVNHLSRASSDKPSVMSSAYTLLLGLLALCMRQTNVFWAVVYMGGLEVVQGVKALRPESIPTPTFTTLSEQVRFYTWRYSLGDIHDPPLNLTTPVDILLSAISIGVATICNSGTIIRRRIWPHLLILGAFVSFVVWNGGVVLGDKSNHIATLHLAQMLYIWPLFAFFSAPLFIPRLTGLAIDVFNIIAGSGKSAPPSGKAPIPKSRSDRTSEANQSPALKTVNCVGSSHTLHSIIVLACALAATTLVVKYNTIVHPFTLADNRHYMFYIFRYTILKSHWVRYALIPAYIVCGWLCWAALRGSPFSTVSRRGPSWIRTPFGGEFGSITTAAVDNKPSHTGRKGSNLIATPPPTSTVLILLLASALSLVTAPLVEPRYFILPWVFWRLLVPGGPAFPTTKSESSLLSLASRRLVLLAETAWFLLINAVTMYVFVTRPFYWRAPDGALLDDGRVQRFMW